MKKDSKKTYLTQTDYQQSKLKVLIEQTAQTINLAPSLTVSPWGFMGMPRRGHKKGSKDNE